KPGSYFGRLRDRPGLHRAFQRTLEELRAAGVGPESMPDAAFADRRKPHEIAAVLTRYEALLDRAKAADGIEVLRRAAATDVLPGGAIYLLPADTELSNLERHFLERLAGEGLTVLEVDAPEAWKPQAHGARLLRAIGEENEIREVFRRILADG